MNSNPSILAQEASLINGIDQRNAKRRLKAAQLFALF